MPTISHATVCSLAFSEDSCILDNYLICVPVSSFFPFYYNYILIFSHCTHCKNKKMMEEQEEEEKFLSLHVLLQFCSPKSQHPERPVYNHILVFYFIPILLFTLFWLDHHHHCWLHFHCREPAFAKLHTSSPNGNFAVLIHEVLDTFNT